MSRQALGACAYVACSVLLLFLAVFGKSAAQMPDSVIRVPANDVGYVQYSKDGRYLLTRQRDTVRVWDASTGNQAGVPVPTGNTYCCVAFLPGDTTLLTLAYNSDSVFKVWKWRTGELLKSVPLFRPIQEASVTGDGRFLAIRVNYPKKQYELWDAVAGIYKDAFFESDGKFYGILMNTSGDYAVARSSTRPLIARIDVQRHSYDSIPVDERYVSDLYLSSDGSRIGCTRSDYPPIIVDLITLDSLYPLDIDMRHSALVSMAFVDDNRWIVTLTGRFTEASTLEIWDARDGKHIGVLSTDSAIRRGIVKASPSGNQLAIYNVPSGMLLWPLQLPGSSVPVVAGIDTRWIQAVPNPANGMVDIAYSLASPGDVRVRLLALNGTQVAMAEHLGQEGGIWREHFDTRMLPSGMYLCIVETSSHRSIAPLVVEH